MQVNSNYQSSNYEYSNNTSPSKTGSSTFDALLTKTEEPTQTEEKSRIIAFLEKHNRFDSLPQEEEKLVRDILSDDKLSMTEMNSLSYKEVEKIVDFIHVQHLPKEEIANMPIVSTTNQITDMLFATQTTNNRTFNEAMYRTSKEINNDRDRSSIINEVKDNLSQVHFGQPLKASFYADAFRGNLWKEDIDAMNIDFESFLSNIINLHETAIVNPKIHPEAVKQHQDTVNGYNIIQKHFTQIENENKYA